MARAQVPFYSLNAGEIENAALARVDLEKMRMAADLMVNFMPLVLGPMQMRPGLSYLGSTNADAQSVFVPFVYNATTTSLIEVSAAGMRALNSDVPVSYVNNSTVTNNGTFTPVSATFTRTATTVTVTKTAHGRTTGDVIYFNDLTNTISDGWYTLTGSTTNTFTFTTSGTGAVGSTNCEYTYGWLDASTADSVSLFYDGAGYVALRGTKYGYARVYQAVTVISADRSKEHCLKVNVVRGPVTVRVGSTNNGNDVLVDQTLDSGYHFLAFTPNNATIYITIEGNAIGGSDRVVTEVNFFKNAQMLVPTPWAVGDLNSIRYSQSASVIFIACAGYPPYKIERRGNNSWSVAKYETTAGPYRGYSATKIKLKVSGYTGTQTVTSDQNFFNSGMVGSVFQITHPVQRPIVVFTGDSQSSEPIRVTGVNTSDRAFTLSISAPSGATVQLERAFGVPEGWTSFVSQYPVANVGTFTTAQTNTTIDDSVGTSSPPTASSNGEVVYYRLTTRAGTTVTTPITASMYYEGGTTIGSFRIVAYNSPTSVTVDIIKPVAATSYTDDWREGSWSTFRGWPSSVALHDGRLWWAGTDKVYGSVSDDFYNHDPETVGDSGPILRSIATGPVEGITWMLGMRRLLVGTASAEVSVQASRFDEPLTPTQFTARNSSTNGSAGVQAAVVDTSGIYVQRNGVKVFELAIDQSGDYGSEELTRLNQEIGQPGIIRMAVQRQPDTRLWFVKSDGTACVLLFDKKDNVVGWSRVTSTNGAFEDVTVLPAGASDTIYFIVRRTINGSTKRYIEKFTTTSVDDRYLCDANYHWTSGSATTAVTGLTHLAGQTVTVFSPNSTGFAVAPATYTVSAGGTFTLSSAQTDLIIGIPYTAQFQSVKLAYGSQAGTGLTQKKRVDHFAFVGQKVVPEGIRIGRDFTNMTGIPIVYKGKALAANTLLTDWDYEATGFNGGWDTDSRFCIQVTSPYPASISGVVINMKNNDRG